MRRRVGTQAGRAPVWMIVPTCCAPQRGGQPARNETVHDLHALDVAGGGHDLQEGAVERQRALQLFQVCNVRFTQ
jgi:hypothetical protein